MRKAVDQRSRQANWQQVNAEHGLCAQCRAECAGYRCPLCNKKRRPKAKLLMRERRKNGLA